MKIVYETKCISHGGRNGQVVSIDNALKLDLGMPKELTGGTIPAEGKTNPEQLLAAAIAADFDTAVNFLGKVQRKLNYRHTKTQALVRLVEVPNVGWVLNLEIATQFFGLDQKTAAELVTQALQSSPYTRALQNNVEIKLRAQGDLG